MVDFSCDCPNTKLASPNHHCICHDHSIALTNSRMVRAMPIELLDPRETAKLFKVSPKTLERMRQVGDGPRFVKIGRRILYERSAIEEYLNHRSFNSTSEYDSRLLPRLRGNGGSLK
jgi:predicted DNA-binding transcriptional regulator AlpA